MINRTDIEATLRALLWRFQASSEQGPAQIARFAQAGAQALLTQAQLETWLDSAASGALLGLTPEALLVQVRDGALPARPSSSGEPGFHWRDLSLYQMCRQLGPTELPIMPLDQPSYWSTGRTLVVTPDNDKQAKPRRRTTDSHR